MVLALALVSSAHGDEYFRLKMGPVTFDGGAVETPSGGEPEEGLPPAAGENASIEISMPSVVNGKFVTRLDSSVSIRAIVSGVDASHSISVVDLPGASWTRDGDDYGSGSILWTASATGNWNPILEVRDAAGDLVASATIDLTVGGALTASVPQTSYVGIVGEGLTISATAGNAIGAVVWGSNPSTLPNWMTLNAGTGRIVVDTAMRRDATTLAMTAVDQSDLASTSTQPFSIRVADSCEVWVPRSATEANAWQSVAYGNGRFVAVANTGTNRVMTSTDGAEWTAAPSATQAKWQSVAYGNGTFVAVASNDTITSTVMTSTNGTDWVSRTAPGLGAWQSVAYGNGIFVAVGNAGATRVMTSADGVTWTARTPAEATTWVAVAYGTGSTFGAVASNGLIMASTDGGATWVKRNSVNSSNAWASVAYGKSYFHTVGKSTDGLVGIFTGSTVPAGGTSAENNKWSSIAFGNDLFVAVSEDGTNRIMTSPDGRNWAARPAAAQSTWRSVAHGNGTFVAVASAGTNRIMTSTCR